MFFLSIAGLWLGLQQPLVDNELEARWRREYPAAAASLKADLDRFLCRGRIEFRFFVGDVRVTNEFVIAASGAKRLMIYQDETQKSAKTGQINKRSSLVQVRTPDYWFDLERPHGTEQFLINQYAPGKPSKDLLFDAFFPAFSQSSVALNLDPLSDVMNSPEFKLISIQRKQADEREVVRIECDILKKDQIFRFDADLDPSRNWIKTRWGSSVRKTDEPVEALRHSYYAEQWADYVEFSPGHFLPKKVVSHMRLKDPKSFQHVVVEYDKVIPGEPPEEMFKLSGYGLPDVPLSAAPPPNFFSLKNPIFWVCLGVAGASLGLLGFLRRKGTTSTAAG